MDSVIPDDSVSSHVLLLGKGPEFDALRAKLLKQPSVKTIAYCDNVHYAFGYIRGRPINTIVLDPFSMDDGIDDACYLIFHVRMEFPRIVFVLFINPERLGQESSSFFRLGTWTRSLTKPEKEFYCAERGRLAHYFRLDKRRAHEDDFSAAVEETLAKCLLWHSSRETELPKLASYEYDVALSFAGEDRQYAEAIAAILTAKGVRVFYDSYEQANLWGKNLFEHLHNIYSKKALYCIMLVSSAYASKMWTVHERRAAQERALHERQNEYILPVRIDGTDLPGLSSTVGYASIAAGGPQGVAELFIKKLAATLESLS